MDTEDRFGCERCWPDSAEAAWEARKSLAPVAELVDESHFRVQVLACRTCRQQFVSAFTETIDWVDGDDPQFWVVVPITDTECAELSRPGRAPGAATLGALAPGRRSLRRDYPKGEEPRCYWGAGMAIGHHS